MKISVVVPCRNESKYIAECIDAIFKCELADNSELNVFIVDGMSDDGTRQIVLDLMENYPFLHLIDNLNLLTPFAFNLGIHAGGKVDYVQIVGARHILSSNYLLKSIQRIENDSTVWCVGGKIINEFINETGQVISKAMSTSFGMGIGNFRTLNESGFTDTVTSPMYPYWVFDKIGFFDEELIRNQDDDFNYRIKKAGGKIFFDNELSLKYYVRGSYTSLSRQFFQYGYWKVFVNKKHKAVTTLRQVVPPFFVLYIFLWLISLFGGKFIFILSSIPLLGYISLNFYFSIKFKDQKVKWFAIFKTYLILHVFYGLGYLKGVLDFFLLNQKPSNKQKRLSR
ncbi:MAG: glycosyltransferase family 2 protein [Flavobacteriia bacterium]|nr:glycosyltransferase family 2 protein [Flavobacteriia bacterium]